MQPKPVPNVLVLPPRVDCALLFCKNPPPPPGNNDEVAWSLWSIETYGTIECERAQRTLEHACVNALKSKGVIR